MNLNEICADEASSKGTTHYIREVILIEMWILTMTLIWIIPPDQNSVLHKTSSKNFH